MNMNCNSCNNMPRQQYAGRNGRIPYAPMDNSYSFDDASVSRGRRVENEIKDKTAIDRGNIVRKLYEYGFVMTEVLLYLDTHPCDMEALEYYNEMKEKYNEIVEFYEKNCGPLTAFNVSCDSHWSWVSTSMPWEMEGC